MTERESPKPEIPEPTPAEFVSKLVGNLGVELVTLMTIEDVDVWRESREESLKDVNSWLSGEVEPSPEVLERVKIANQYVDDLLQYESAEDIRAFFMGRNPSLDENAPIRIMRKDPQAVGMAVGDFIING